MNPEEKKNEIKLLENKVSYHSICGLGEPDTSIVKTASVCSNASVSVGFLLIFGAARE